MGKKSSGKRKEAARTESTDTLIKLDDFPPLGLTGSGSSSGSVSAPSISICGSGSGSGSVSGSGSGVGEVEEGVEGEVERIEGVEEDVEKEEGDEEDNENEEGGGEGEGEEEKDEDREGEGGEEEDDDDEDEDDITRYQRELEEKHQQRIKEEQRLALSATTAVRIDNSASYMDELLLSTLLKVKTVIVLYEMRGCRCRECVCVYVCV